MDRDDRIGRRDLLAGVGLAAASLAGLPTATARRQDAGPRTAGTLWATDLHGTMARIACEQAGLDPRDAFTAMASTTAPDRWDCDCDPDAIAADVVPDWFPAETENSVARAVERLPVSYNHYYNPGMEVAAWGYSVDVGGFGNAPDNAGKYADRAGEATGRERYRNLGYALHFVTDVGQPLHTGEEFDQARNQWVHRRYEDGIVRLWGQLEDAFRGDGEAESIADPHDATQDLARVSHAHSKAVYELVEGTPEWVDDPATRRAVLEETRPCLRATGRYARGVVDYVESGAEDGDDAGFDWWEW